MPQTFKFKLESFHNEGKPKTLDDYISKIVSDFKVDRGEFNKEVYGITPSSITLEDIEKSTIFNVTADTLEKALQEMDNFARDFRDLVIEYVPKEEIRNYGILAYRAITD